MLKYDIFEIENDLLVINKNYVRGIPEFRSILERDKGTKGDLDGRKKFRAYKEFYYIKLVADKFCYPAMAGMNDKETHITSVKESQLEEDYKPDKLIKDAIVKYREIQDLTTPTINTIHSVLQGLKVSNVICQNIIKNIQATIDINETAKQIKIDAGEPIDLAADLALTGALVQQLEQLFKIAKSIPVIIDTLEKLEVKLAKEVSGTNLTRGGREKGNRADPT